MSAHKQSEMIQSSAALSEAIVEMAACDTLCIDTEFIRERTYYPELCLLQVADGQRSWCIDALAITDLGPFLDLCNDSNIVKVLHSARQDLEIFYQLMQAVPGPVFDTQLAAALSGHGEQVSYAALVKELLGVELDKSQTRTDWSRRPLSTAQIEYALNDVAYLTSLKEKLTQELSRLGRLAWFEEDSLKLEEADTYSVRPEQAWQKVKGIGHLEVTAFRRASVLAEWREHAAQTKNLPRTWVLKDPAIIAIAESPAISLSEHQADGLLTPKQLRRWSSEIKTALEQDTSHIDPPPFLGVRRLDEDQKRLFKLISGHVKRAAQDLGIAASLLANRREMEKLARGAADSSLFHGWRAGVVGSTIQQMLAEVPKST